MSNIDDLQRTQHWNGAVVAATTDNLSSLLNLPSCPRCGTPMLLSRLEPHPTQAGAADDITYECGCGEQLTKTVATK